ncbi:PIG-L family deacetylase [Mycolicibacterium hippocampi]|uniref:GlcNAc-PI de-N-acetylase n=1 Tax=Mycolicibacterium hippocampi TaxID=659824 RepID=A0A850PSD2_9MYCO|nr:PIG-L family deacetylase [Mycolicibacterium hippocampi]NVN53448.1 hypothetical protein [Mycolicibacterium hippocampi]
MNFQNAILVVAHPDDEILWFSSILSHCKGVLVCFGASFTSQQRWDSGRSALMEEYPLTKVRFLKLRESDAFATADWGNPKQVDSGLELPRGRSSVYEKNATRLLRVLEGELTHESLVVTHNPWGEYGHEEHVQVFRTLARLKQKIGFDLYVNSYVSNKSIQLMSKCAHSLDGNPSMRQTDKALAHRLRALYLENDCWTWIVDYDWPTYESFYRVIEPVDETVPGTRASVPLNYIPGNFNQSPLRKLASKALPTTVKSLIKHVSPGE